MPDTKINFKPSKTSSKTFIDADIFGRVTWRKINELMDHVYSNQHSFRH